MSNMDINQVLAQMRVLRDQASSTKVQTESPVDFQSLLKDSINKVNDTQQQANKLAEAFETGTTDASLAEVMVSLQKASVSFQAMVQVRNKLVEAYKDVMNMPM
ncbi:flagellar hook-basal body complex protein FliE [Methylococcus sp. EFPC2]|uniref:flagellar hook-basal body complex protein FliE n=1 Tax=Methylococcus sp. EFPC2 TaxID=2812648 RepID=UPI0019673C8B|nr:flagellar hook-basal body complex protein FliE [Methylococcus sp. EFPC2]QSA98543.1 flagellar hook-basal body complex protein FliE [Methylococcus sp. EFPC2]